MKKQKRAQGEGSLYQLKDGRWQAAVSIGYQKRRTRTCDTQKEARQWLTEMTRRKDSGLSLADPRTTVGAFLTRWLDEVVKPSVRPATYRAYEQTTRNHLLPNLGRIQLGQLSPSHVTAMLKQAHDRGISAKPLQRVLTTALNHALRLEVIGRNVAALATCPRRTPKPAQFLSADQAKAYLEAAKGNRFEGLLAVALFCGLRLGECRGLKWTDIDLLAGTMRVERQAQRMKGRGIELVEVKSRKARRTIPIPGPVVDILRSQRLRQELSDIPAAGENWQESGIVFTSTVGTVAEDTRIREAHRAILRKANLPRIRVHDLRHSCGSLLLSQGVDLRTIQEILGHSEFSLTANVYSHVLPVLTQDAADKMGRLLGS